MEMSEAPKESERKPGASRISAALESSVPEIYANGYTMGFTPSDIIVALERNGRPVATLNFSLSMAKTLSEGLSRSISDLERASERKVMTSAEMQKAVNAVSETKVKSKSKTRERTSSTKRNPSSAPSRRGES